MVFAASDSYQTTSFEKRYDSDGSVWLQITAHGALTANTPYKVYMGQYGFVTAALADDTTYFYVGVPANTVASGAVDWVQIGGRVSAMITPSLSMTAGHALSILDGAVADVGAAFTGLAGQFAVSATTASSSTTQDVILCPEQIIGTT